MLRYDVQDGVAILTLDDPMRRNILSESLCRAMIAGVAQAEADPAVHALIVTGEGKAFCAGADLSDLEAAAQGDDAAVRTVYRSFMAVARCALPTIAAINGAAIGAGLNLALACDMRIASRGAVFDTRFLKIGLHPGGGHGWLLLRAVGWAQASRLLLGGQVLRGEQALGIGLVEQLADDDRLMATALELARPMVATPRALLLRTKASLRLAARSDHDTALVHETAEQAWSLGEPAFAERVATAKDRLGTGQRFDTLSSSR